MIIVYKKNVILKINEERVKEYEAKGYKVAKKQNKKEEKPIENKENKPIEKDSKKQNKKEEK